MANKITGEIVEEWGACILRTGSIKSSPLFLT
jgi:hypothetical protein